jgi:hypothetical protein
MKYSVQCGGHPAMRRIDHANAAGIGRWQGEVAVTGAQRADGVTVSS